MKTYRIKIKLRGSYITPFDADTVFGGLCWTIRYTEGEDFLKSFLAGYFAGTPPLIISNAFPQDLLPKPLIPVKYEGFRTKQEMISAAKEAKRVKKIDYLSPEEFFSLVQNISVNVAIKDKPVNQFVTMHNQIDRNHDSAAEGGQLFEVSEYYNNPRYDCFSIYIRVKDDFAEKVPEMFERLGQTGLGKRKSTGKGAFTVDCYQEYNDFDNITFANAFVSLSNFVPAPQDPTKGYYKLIVKFGKLGEHYALTENPFKRPLIMIKAGSVFFTEQVRPFYGQQVKSIVPSFPDVVQYGYAFAVPVFINQEELC